MDRIIIKPRLYRLAKAGKVQLMGVGRYSTVTQEVKDKKEKLKNSYLSLTQTVTVGVAVTLPLQPDKTMEELASRPPTEDALRQLGLTFSSVPTDHAVASLVLPLPSAPPPVPCASVVGGPNGRVKTKLATA